MPFSVYRKALLTLSVVWAAGTSMPTYALPRYTITDLGTLGGTRSDARGINNRAEVVGSSDVAGNTSIRPFLYSNDAMRDLGSLMPGPALGVGEAVNDSGQVTGYSSPYTTLIAHGFIYSDGVMRDIGILGGSSIGFDLNNAGQVAGHSQLTNGAWRAFLYSGGTMTNLGTLPGGDYSSARGINNGGQVVGTALTSPSGVPFDQITRSAFIYSDGLMRHLGSLGRRLNDAFAINDEGQAVGASSLPGEGGTRAFLYDNGRVIDLGTLGGTQSIAQDINNARQVVEDSFLANTPFRQHAFLFENGVITDLSTLPDVLAAGWEFLIYAEGINERGQIAGARVINSTTHAFLLTPSGEVPEPSVSLLVLAGTLALGGAQGRRT
jgi:probable HAF family extracellular repeat protein